MSSSPRWKSPQWKTPRWKTAVRDVAIAALVVSFAPGHASATTETAAGSAGKASAKASAKTDFSCVFENAAGIALKVLVYEDEASRPLERDLADGQRATLDFGALACDSQRTLSFSVFAQEQSSHLAEGQVSLRTGSRRGSGCAGAEMRFELCQADPGDGVEMDCRLRRGAGIVRVQPEKEPR